MRYQGKITKWIDDKGFGFITQNDSNEQVFVHVSGFEKGQQRPNIGENVSYEVANDVKKGLQAYNVTYLNRKSVLKSERIVRASRSGIKLSTLAKVVVLLLIGIFLFKKTYFSNVEQPSGKSSAPDFYQDKVTASNQSFQCSGKTHCNEMASCEEAMFYLKNCPGTIADGDGDGIPCEEQWCGH